MVDRYHSWQESRVAEQMGALAQQHLGMPDWKAHLPFKYFLQALEHVSGQTFLDMGCGVGHYSEILERIYSGFCYTGIDFSEAMIEEGRRRWPGRTFQVGDALSFDYSPYDVVMVSSVIEIMEDWLDAVEALGRTVRGQLLLHRIRICEGPTRRADSFGYPAQPTYTWTHNEGELLDTFSALGFDVVWNVRWDELGMATYVLEKA